MFKIFKSQSDKAYDNAVAVLAAASASCQEQRDRAVLPDHLRTAEIVHKGIYCWVMRDASGQLFNVEFNDDLSRPFAIVTASS